MASYLLSKINPVPSFPTHIGPYEVGTIDLEIPVLQFVENGLSPPVPKHSSDISTIQFRIFYPAALKGKAEPSTHSARWLPTPRREYVAAYGRFVGAGPWLANVLSYIPRLLYYINVPATAGHTILQPGDQDGHQVPTKFPTVVFSHGLGGTRNTYSYLASSIASHGAVVFCTEHRDGSAPTTFIREPKNSNNKLKRGDSQKIEADGIPATPSSSESSDAGDESEKVDVHKISQKIADLKVKDKSEPILYGNRRRIDYISHSHEISDSTAALRNKQFEIRLWEIGVLFAAIQKLNSGWTDDDVDEDIYVHPSKRNSEDIAEIFEMFKGRLNVEEPSSITWIGHSFGAATTTQWVKSVWYWPKFRDSKELEEPLYVPTDNILKHFHPDGTMAGKPPPAIILDLWCLPLLGRRTRPMWKLPLPGATMGILSQQFYKWNDNLQGTRHVLSIGGGAESFFKPEDEVDEAITPHTELIPGEESLERKKLRRSSTLDVTPQLPTGLSESDEAKISENAIEDSSLNLTRTNSKSSKATKGQPDRKLYFTPTSAHMSQSDFGVLFPRSAKYFGKVDDSERILHLNSRAIVEFMREQGSSVAPYGQDTDGDKEIFGEEKVTGWELVAMELEERISKASKDEADDNGTKGSRL